MSYYFYDNCSIETIKTCDLAFKRWLIPHLEWTIHRLTLQYPANSWCLNHLSDMHFVSIVSIHNFPIKGHY